MAIQGDTPAALLGPTKGSSTGQQLPQTEAKARCLQGSIKTEQAPDGTSARYFPSWQQFRHCLSPFLYLIILD